MENVSPLWVLEDEGSFAPPQTNRLERIFAYIGTNLNFHIAELVVGASSIWSNHTVDGIHLSPFRFRPNTFSWDTALFDNFTYCVYYRAIRWPYA